jgi:hydroxymethylglutaryl-CoA lyase
MTPEVKIIECPRDAMQGITEWIPTESKIRYINHLLKMGFDTLDMGSFVSPKAIPQMRDTAQVLRGLNLDNAKSRLLCIVANMKGAQQAVEFDEIAYLGFPMSISETFQQRNTNSGLDKGFSDLIEIHKLATAKKKSMVVYLSMGFGNPYGDAWSPDLLMDWSSKIFAEMGEVTIALSDTIGCATNELLTASFFNLTREFPSAEFGAHLHVKPNDAHQRFMAAWNAGCRRFDGALNGLGGCPMASDKLTGNMPTEVMLKALTSLDINHGIDDENTSQALSLLQTLPGMH